GSSRLGLVRQFVGEAADAGVPVRPAARLARVMGAAEAALGPVAVRRVVRVLGGVALLPGARVAVRRAVRVPVGELLLPGAQSTVTRVVRVRVAATAALRNARPPRKVGCRA